MSAADRTGIGGSDAPARQAAAPGGGLPVLRALRSRPFALVWSGQTVSRLGDNLYRIALVWWVTRQTGSAAALAGLLTCALLPTLLLLVWGGVLGDRLPRLRVMLWADLVRAGLALGIMALAATETLTYWHLCLASLGFGAVGAFFGPAYAAVVPELAPADALPSANALTTLSAQLGSVAGPALAAGLVAGLGPTVAFGLDALSFVVAAACVLPLLRGGCAAHAPAGAGAVPRPGLLADLRAGLDAVRGRPWLWRSILIGALGNLTLVAPFAVSLPVLVRADLHAGVDALGAILSGHALGAGLTSAWLGHYRRFPRRGMLAYGALLAAGAGLAALSLPIGFAGVGLAGALFGAALTTHGLIWTLLLQDRVPAALRSRVESVDLLGSLALLPLGYALVGQATDLAGAPLVFAGGGLLTMALAAAGLCHPTIRDLD